MLYIPIYLPPMNLPLYALWCLADVAGLVAEDDEPDRPFTMQTQVVTDIGIHVLVGDVGE